MAETRSAEFDERGVRGLLDFESGVSGVEGEVLWLTLGDALSCVFEGRECFEAAVVHETQARTKNIVTEGSDFRTRRYFLIMLFMGDGSFAQAGTSVAESGGWYPHHTADSG